MTFHRNADFWSFWLIFVKNEHFQNLCNFFIIHPFGLKIGGNKCPPIRSISTKFQPKRINFTQKIFQKLSEHYDWWPCRYVLCLWNLVELCGIPDCSKSSRHLLPDTKSNNSPTLNNYTLLPSRFMFKTKLLNSLCARERELVGPAAPLGAIA